MPHFFTPFQMTDCLTKNWHVELASKPYSPSVILVVKSKTTLPLSLKSLETTQNNRLHHQDHM